LEARWNSALQAVAELELRLRKDEQSPQAARVPDRETLHNLAHDLATVWNSPATDMRLKQRIVRILAAEIIADVDQENQEIVLLIHWAGGQHSELRIKKNRTGQHSRCTSLEGIEIIRRMAGKFPDDQIAATLNRLGLRTGAGMARGECPFSPQLSPIASVCIGSIEGRYAYPGTGIGALGRESQNRPAAY
jgi:hypothetical protein